LINWPYLVSAFVQKILKFDVKLSSVIKYQTAIDIGKIPFLVINPILSLNGLHIRSQQEKFISDILSRLYDQKVFFFRSKEVYYDALLTNENNIDFINCYQISSKNF
jgi:hypothetical protein